MSYTLKIKNKQGADSYRIYLCLNGKRKTIYFSSRYRRSDVEEYRRLVEAIIAAQSVGRQLLPKDQAILNALPSEVKKKLAGLGLLEDFEILSLGEIWERFLTESTRGMKRKDSTILTYETAEKRFFGYFPKEAHPDSITVEDGMDFRTWMLNEKYAEATVATTIGRIRTVMSWAVKRRYVSRNVFLEVKKGATDNKDREFDVPLEWFRAILNECPNQEWRTFITLMRIGGLRYSETKTVTWRNIDWDKGWMLVRSSKTEQHEGHESRLVPLFPELRKELSVQFELAGPRDVYVLETFQNNSGQNLANRFKRIVERAGYEVWERIFQNLRASRSNEIFEEFPILDAEKIMGQSAKVVRKHYHHLTNTTIERATTWTAPETTRVTCNSSMMTSSVQDCANSDALPSETGLNRAKERYSNKIS